MFRPGPGRLPGTVELRLLLTSLSNVRHDTHNRINICKGCQRLFTSNNNKRSSYKKISIGASKEPSSPVYSISLSSINCTGVLHNTFKCLRPFNKTFCMNTNQTSISTTKDNSTNIPKASSTSPKSKAIPEISTSSTKVNLEPDPKEHLSGKESSASTDSTTEDAKKKEKILKIKPRMRNTKPLDFSYTGNIYILPSRAVMEYLLKPGELSDLPKYSRRSPYGDGARITLYLRTDIEGLALKKWGTFDLLNKEKSRLRQELTGSRDWKQYILFRDGASMSDSSSLPDNTANMEVPSEAPSDPENSFWTSGSTKVVLSAIVVNGLNSLFKFIAWMYTGSHSMFSEFIHSMADTVNQIILGVGLYHSFKKPDPNHPYGYRNLRHISSLISGVGIFCLGAGFSMYHGVIGLTQPHELGSLTWCIATLIGSFVSEGATLIIAIKQVKKASKKEKMSFVEYVRRGIDPNVNVVLLEDMAAVVGVGIAGSAITISHITGSPIADSIGSFAIGSLLGGVASFIIWSSTNQLVGRSIPQEERQDISLLLERDRMIRSLHDIKATQMGGVVRYKAEVDFDGREITRQYLYKQDMDLLFRASQELQTTDDFEIFMMNHGEKIIDTLGEEVDRIEKSLKAKHPEIRHVDLEAL